MRRFITLLVAAGVLVLALAPAASAKTTRVPVAADEVLASVISEGSSSMHGPVVSARGMVWMTAVSGSDLLQGPDTVVINYELNTATGTGALWGTNVLEPSAYPGGSFRCSWSATFVSYVWTGNIVCHGAGSLEGWQLRLSIVAEPGGMADTLSGFAFVPGT